MPQTKYSALWPEDNDPLEIEMNCIRLGGKWVNKSGIHCGQGLSFHYEQMRRIIWPELDGDHNGQRWHALTREEIIRNKITVLAGCGCVAGSTRIPNPITGESPTIESLYANRIQPTVMTLHGPELASIPFIKGYDRLYRITLADGSSFSATARHRVLSDQGFRHVSELKIGQCLFSYGQSHPSSISEHGHSIHGTNVRHYSKTIPDYRSDCSAYFHPDDALLRAARDSAQEPFPSQACVRARREDVSSDMDAWASELAGIHLYPEVFHPSNCNASHRLQMPETPDQHPVPSEIYEPLNPSCQFDGQSQPMRRPVCSFSTRGLYFGSKPNIFSGRIWKNQLPFSSVPIGTIVPVCQTTSRPTLDLRHVCGMPSASVCCDHPSGSNNGSLPFKVSLSAVIAIENEGFQIYYDLTVPEAAHYFAEGTIHHNSSGKTHSAAWLFLCEWMCFPEETCVLVSSTDIRGLRLRVWGEITMLWEKATQRFDYLPGHLLDSKLAITAKKIEKLEGGEGYNDRSVRDLRQAIVGIPTVQGGKFVGLGKFVGIKAKRMRLIADEAQCMGSGFLSAFANLNKNEDFKAIVLGNPSDILDPLGRAAEPADGWDTHLEPSKTEVWRTRFMGGTCVNLIGTDSPNFDFPEDQPTRFKYLISRDKIADTVSFFGKDSFEYYSQCVGAFKIGNMARRVLTRRICEQGLALDKDVIWKYANRTKVYFVDAAYGGDRCVAGHAEFGETTDGKTRLLLHPPNIIPISASGDKEPEQQISEYVKAECEGLGIPPQNMGHDATGRGSLGTYLARVWSALTNPIESGGMPTERPVSADIFIIDPKTGIRRLKTCREHYIKLVTEFWFSVRYTVEASQLRGMTEETMEEFCMRQWDIGTNDRRVIESKIDMKDRIGRSPDLADWVAGIVEMARRRGFVISKLANETQQTNPTPEYLAELAARRAKMERAKELNYAA